MIIVSSHYLPCIQWFQTVLSGEEVMLDVYEHFLKQTYRNRTTILSANGKLALTIPVKKAANHTPIVDIQIENDFPWQHQHWQAIVSAYNSAPYFFYYQDYFKPFYEKEFTTLVEWNKALLEVSMKLMKMEVPMKYSQQYCATGTDLDYRTVITPKNKEAVVTPKYLQVFSEKFPFEPNLSIIDVLFNQGPRWKESL
ncbi:MAG: WbqC family protein [Bacteroidota bacterium]